ncbi:GNAT family N-acetyltransferase [Companilactobacillus jidongensis]|uniref:GNAT family N-acetyltransferase n=1 Tax=Companilactobacillus jidongensis TaxID=2486006 RepID=UPI000F7673B0|nr:GNAT family N-acetyltransferase [Companilactobacillus jidongensis]
MIKIRSAMESDVQALLDIYKPYVLKTDITFEYDVPSIEEFTKRIRSISQVYPYLIAEEDGQILGYAYASKYNDRAAYDWTAETSIYLDSESKGKGIGGMLYQSLEADLTKQGIVNLFACITGNNQGSVNFHKKMGYSDMGRFEKAGFKFGNWLDIIWMQKTLNEHVHEMNPIKVFKKIE